MQKFAITYSYRTSAVEPLQQIMHYVEADNLAHATRIAANSLEVERIMPVNRDGTNGVAILSDNVQMLKVSPLTRRNIVAETEAIQEGLSRYNASSPPQRPRF